MNGTQTNYTLQDQESLQSFIAGVANAERKGGAVLDSAAASSVALDSLKNSTDTPRVLSELLGLTANEDKIVQAIFDGVSSFEQAHGFMPTGDLLLSAVHQARALFDNVTNGHHDQASINPNAPIVAIMGALAEATPFAGYLPADKGSNEARLIIVNHLAGSNWGAYNQNDLMDGIAAGGEYFGSTRTLELTAPNDTANYKYTFKAQAAAGSAVKLLRGRTIAYVNGMIAAQEIGNAQSQAATVNVAGTVTIDGTEYALSGTVKPALGEVVLTPAPAFPAGTSVAVEAFVDYEADESVTPRVGVQAAAYSLFASPYRALYQITPESRSQFANEVGIDAGAEAMLTVRGQFATERHYNALAKAKLIGKYTNALTFDFGYADQILQKTQAQIWQNFQSVLGVASQKMAELTYDHGITHLYVGKEVLAQFRSMGRDMFEPSGIVDRPGIFRAGRLFGMYEVYYTPKVVIEAAGGTSAEILAIGRSTQTARCPIIFGDASAPVFEPLGVNADMKSGYAFHARCFTAQNPHSFSAKGAALITVTNLK